MRIGILGGTFDPIHYGHLIAADAACRALALDSVLFIPCGYPPHKDPSLAATAEHRYRMTVLATSSYHRFFVSRLELDRPGPSYTVDTLRTLRQQYGDRAELFLMVGSDAFLDMPSWKEPDVIMTLAKIIVISRRGYDNDELNRRIASLPLELRCRVQHLPAVAPQISSHELRELIRKNQPFQYYVPPPVSSYILKHDLYRS